MRAAGLSASRGGRDGGPAARARRKKARRREPTTGMAQLTTTCNLIELVEQQHKSEALAMPHRRLSRAAACPLIAATRGSPQRCDRVRAECHGCVNDAICVAAALLLELGRLKKFIHWITIVCGRSAPLARGLVSCVFFHENTSKSMEKSKMGVTDSSSF